MTPHDQKRYVRALACDLNDLDSVKDALRGLQSTDDPALVPLFDELRVRLKAVENIPSRPTEMTSRLAESLARMVEAGRCGFDADREGPLDGFTCGSCGESLGCERPSIAALLRSTLAREIIGTILRTQMG